MTFATKGKPNLPWGHWLFATDDRFRSGGLRDENGRVWSSVREAFWCGRLGMDGTSKVVMEEKLEFLLGVLTTMRARQLHSREATEDIFAGSTMFQRFYMLWLFSVGLTGGPGGDYMAPLTDEALSALRMLMVTRSPRFGFVPLGLETLRALASPRCDAESQEAWFANADAVAAKLPYRFMRQDIVDQHAIVLVGDELGDGIPIGRTLWSQTFVDEATRDSFFRWLCIRMERWETWGVGAYRNGASSLTQHLLSLVAAGMPTLTNTEDL